MKFKKVVSCTLAVMLALGTFTVLPDRLNDKIGIAVTAKEAENPEKDFIIDTDIEGKKYIDGYKGSGGDVVIPKDISYISNSAFEGVSQITSVTAEGDLYVQGNGFQGCTRLKRVVVNGNASFESYAFDKCVSLETVEVSGSIYKTIGGNAFANCTKLRTFKVKGSEFIYSISGLAFFNCINLTNVTITNGCSQIADRAFLNCPSLGSLTIPAKTKVAVSSKPFGYTVGWSEADMEKMNDNSDEYKLLNTNFFNSPSDYNSVFNNGTTSLYIDYLSYNALASNSATSYSFDSDYYKLFVNHEKFLPKKITLNVVKGSNAETYAVKNNFAYKIYSDNKLTAAPKDIEVYKSTKNSITLTWDKLRGSDAYDVYIYNNKTYKYEKYKTVKTNSCTIKKLQSGTVYKVKVCGLTKNNGKYVAGPKSKAIAVKTRN